MPTGNSRALLQYIATGRMYTKEAYRYRKIPENIPDSEVEVLDFYAQETKKYKTYLGHYMDPSIQMVAANVSFGKKTWAQPNGKKAGVPLADTISAEKHTDKEGPTAAIKSYGKLDHAGQTNGTILNMWISKSELVAN